MKLTFEVKLPPLLLLSLNSLDTNFNQFDALDLFEFLGKMEEKFPKHLSRTLGLLQNRCLDKICSTEILFSKDSKAHYLDPDLKDIIYRQYFKNSGIYRTVSQAASMLRYLEDEKFHSK
jgi:hypothetical protein